MPGSSNVALMSFCILLSFTHEVKRLMPLQKLSHYMEKREDKQEALLSFTLAYLAKFVMFLFLTSRIFFSPKILKMSNKFGILLLECSFSQLRNKHHMNGNILDTIDIRVLGKELQQARTKRGLTQEEAAKSIGVARTTLTAIEKGERRIKAEELILLAQVYGLQVSDFVRPRLK